MNKAQRDHLIEFSALGIAAGGTGAVLGMFYNLGFDSGDVFAFAGAMAGAAATVAGALWVADRRDRVAHQRETSILTEYCRPVLAKANEIVPLEEVAHDKATYAVFFTELHALRGRLSELPAILKESLAHAHTLDLRERVKVQQAMNAIREFCAFYECCFELPEDDPMDERTWHGILRYLRTGLAELLDALDRD